MSNFINRNHTQIITMWRSPVAVGDGGYLFDYPFEVKGRWEKKANKVIDTNGDEVVCKNVVYLSLLPSDVGLDVQWLSEDVRWFSSIVDTVWLNYGIGSEGDPDVGDWIYLGAITDIPSSEDSTKPETVVGAKEIKAVEVSPDLKGRIFERKVMC